MSERVAILDLGSNSARLIIMQIYQNGSYNLIYHQKESLRLGEGMGDEQLLQPDAMARSYSALKNLAQMCEIMKVDTILAVATAAVRNAKNGMAFLATVEAETGLPIQAISGESEAALGYIGAINTIDVTDAVFFDLGGGSTELTLVKNRRIAASISLPFGAVNLTDQFKTQDKVDKHGLEKLTGYITAKLQKIGWVEPLGLPIVGIGGTARNIAKMEQVRKNYPFSKVHNFRIGPIALEDLYHQLTTSSLAQRRRIAGLSSERADIIVAGISVVKCLFDALRGSHLIISGCGVREGLFFQHYLHNEDLPEIIPDILGHSTLNMLRFYKVGEAHAIHVCHLALSLFDKCRSIHHLDQRDRALLQCAALLHDIGISIYYYDHARHSAYLVENARLFGLTHREQILVAVVAGWHGGLTGKIQRNRVYTEFLDETDWTKARRMASILAVANSLDATQRSLVQAIKVDILPKSVSLALNSSGDISIELESFDKQRKWFNREFGVELVLA